MKHASAGVFTEGGQRVGVCPGEYRLPGLLDQQHEALDEAGVAKTFSDTMSGARDDRPRLCELMAYVREGDTVVVWKLDRLGGNTRTSLRPSRPSPRTFTPGCPANRVGATRLALRHTGS